MTPERLLPGGQVVTVEAASRPWAGLSWEACAVAAASALAAAGVDPREVVDVGLGQLGPGVAVAAVGDKLKGEGLALLVLAQMDAPRQVFLFRVPTPDELELLTQWATAEWLHGLGGVQ